MGAFAIKTESGGLCSGLPEKLRVFNTAVVSPVPAGVVIGREIVPGHTARQYTSQWRGLSLGEAQSIDDLWREVRAGAIRMDYTPTGDIDANAHEVVFREGSKKFRQVGAGSFNVSLELLETK